MVKTIRIEDDKLHVRIGSLVESKNETYEDIIRRLIDFYEKNYNKKRM
jgi:negative regulator of replication initiation